MTPLDFGSGRTTNGFAGHSTHTEAWIEVARSLRAREFLARYPGHFLLSAEAPGELETIEDTLIADDSVCADSGRIRTFELRWIADGASGRGEHRITVGRASTCDVVFRTPGVSKLHAHFQVTGASKLTLTDLGSKNGTLVNGKALRPRQPEPVRPRSRIQFSTVQTMLVDGRELYLLLSRVR